MTRPLLILKTGTARDEIRAAAGDFEDWFRAAAALPAAASPVVASYLGEPLPARAPYAGAILTGSPEMVTSGAPWMLALQAWLRDAVAAGFPLLGVCFGHQILAAALGGRVGDHPGGAELGTVEVALTAAGAADPLLGALPARFPAQSTHVQTVLELPPGAEVLARGDFEPHQALRFGPRAWGVQFHPEFDVAVMDGYLHGTGQQARPTPAAASLLPRFAALAHAACLTGTAPLEWSP